MVLANRPGEPQLYFAILNHELTLPLGPLSQTLSVQEWVKEGLMAVFFFVVGLELKNEFAVGQLSHWRAAALPIVAALGGMITPAAIYYLLNVQDHALFLSGQGDTRGTPVPVATDIAFAVAALTVVARGLPRSLRTFLLTLAIADDLGAVVLIAVLFAVSAPIHVEFLAGCIVALAAMLLLNRRRTPAWLYLLVAVAVWVLALKSGIATSLAAVAAAFTIPVEQSTRLQKALRWPSDYIVLPIFALAAAGVPLGHVTLQSLWSFIPAGIALGLIIGKPVGVLAASYPLIWTGVAEFPKDATHRQFFGVACLCGIGFTMSLYLAALAFNGDKVPADLARLGIMLGSVGATIVGGIVLAFAKKTAPMQTESEPPALP